MANPQLLAQIIESERRRAEQGGTGRPLGLRGDVILSHGQRRRVEELAAFDFTLVRRRSPSSDTWQRQNGGKLMGNGKPRPKFDITDARTGDPVQTEARPAGTVTEAIDRRTIRQAIMTQMLTEIADQILNSGATLTTRNDDGSVKKVGDLATRYEKEKDTTFWMLRDFIKDPEAAFNTRRNKLFVVDNPDDPAVRLPFGSINLVVFRNAMALGEPNSNPNVEEVAKRVVIRAGRSSGYGAQSKDDRGFAGCK